MMLLELLASFRPTARSASALLVMGASFASPTATAQVSAGNAPALNAQNFRDPPASVRPLYRWWLPLAATTDNELRSELSEIAAAGAGGVEVDGMPVPPPVGSRGAFLSQYGFGTSAWSKQMASIFRDAKLRGLSIDFMASALWPTTVPSLTHLNDPAVQQQLAFAAEMVPAGRRRTGELPETARALPEVDTILCADAAKGSRTLSVAAASGQAPGDAILLGSGSRVERAVIATTSSPAGAGCASLASAAMTGATSIQVSGTALVPLVGHRVSVGQGATSDEAIVAAVVAGKDAVAIDLATPLTHDHAKGTLARAGTATLTLVAGTTEAHAGGEPLVDPAQKSLVTVLAAQCTTTPCSEKSGAHMLDASSVRDLTSLVRKDGSLAWSAPPGGAPWWLIAFWQAPDGQSVTDLSAPSPAYVIDYLSKRGAAALTNFYDNRLLTPELRKLVNSTGGAMFEDSYEPGEGLKWTGAFLHEFERRRGYDLKRLLPALTTTSVGARHPMFDFADVGERVREDYRQTWSDLYGDNHIAAYNAWVKHHGLRTRMQIEGGAMEIADLARLPDIPEGENRNFLNNPELWKVIGVGAQLRAHEALLSDECCPVQGGVWATTAGGKPFTVAQGTGAPFGQAGNDTNLNWVYKAFAGGVNQIVWHGFPYLPTPPGTGERSRWPGNSFGGNNGFSEAFGPRMPQWRDYRWINDQLARLQLVLRQGHPQYDLAVFWHDFGVRGLAPNATPFTGYPGLSKMLSTTSALAAAGYTHQYISPAYLSDVSPAAIRDGELFGRRLGAKAFLLNEQEVMPLASLERIRDLALRSTFPLVVVGTSPHRAPGAYRRARSDARIVATMAELRAAAGRPGLKIAFVDSEAAAVDALRRFGILPSAEHVSAPTSPDILSVHRRTSDVDYYFLFNQGTQTASQTLRLSGAGVPFALDQWSGTITPIALYRSAPGSVTLRVRIGANDVKVIAVARTLASQKPLGVHVTRTTAESAGATSKMLFARTSRPGEIATTLSDGKTISSVVTALPSAFDIKAFTLGIDSWSADATGLPGSDHTRVTRIGPIAVNADPRDDRLPDWAALGFPSAAGIGTYSATIRLPKDLTPGTGAFLDLGSVVDTSRVKVNGSELGPIDYQDPSTIDLGFRLHAGVNRIEITVASPLRNAVPVERVAQAPKPTTNGLLGPVRIIPYRDIALAPH